MTGVAHHTTSSTAVDVDRRCAAHRCESRWRETSRQRGAAGEGEAILRQGGDWKNDRILARTPHRPHDHDRDDHDGYDNDTELGMIGRATNQSRSVPVSPELKGYVVNGLCQHSSRAPVCSEVRPRLMDSSFALFSARTRP